jgi:mitochondrial fission protein ELM1
MEALRDDLPASAHRTPRVWLLKGPKLGDYTQLRSLAAALGFPAETKSLTFRRTELLLHLFDRPTLRGLDRGGSDALAPPWPELVLTAGRRNELVARWVKAQSGGRTRIVHVGRPWSRPGAFDLVLTTPQYRLGESPGVVMNDLPLHDVAPPMLETAAAEWRDVLDGPPPRLAVLVGGESGPFVFTSELAERFAADLGAFARRVRATVWLTTSARTPAAFVARLMKRLEPPAHTYVWRPNAVSPSPYRGYLALADGFVVTADSISMVAEAVSTGKPVWVFDVADRRPRHWLRADAYRWKPLTHALAQRFAPERFRRDVYEIHRRLVASGRVAWLDASAMWRERAGSATDGDLARSVAAVRELVGSAQPGSASGG